MSTNPTMDTELEGYNKNGSPGLLRNKGGAMKSKRRAKGGALPEALKKRDEEEEEKAHHKARKAGGKVDGKMPMMRPDKRARGGAAEGDAVGVGHAEDQAALALQHVADAVIRVPDRGQRVLGVVRHGAGSVRMAPT